MNAYQEIRSDLQIGDIALFSEKSHMSTMIKLYTQSSWSHVWMVLRLDEWDKVLLWGIAGISKVSDVGTQKIMKDVQMVPLSEKIKHHNGNIVIR